MEKAESSMTSEGGENKCEADVLAAEEDAEIATAMTTFMKRR